VELHHPRAAAFFWLALTMGAGLPLCGVLAVGAPVAAIALVSACLVASAFVVLLGYRSGVLVATTSSQRQRGRLVIAALIGLSLVALLALQWQ